MTPKYYNQFHKILKLNLSISQFWNILEVIEFKNDPLLRSNTQAENEINLNIQKI